MIASLKGIVQSKKPEGVIVDVNGVGYQVCIPLSSLADVPGRGETVFLHTYTHVREDVLQLFGFLSEEEKKIFTILLGINGVGPKLGLAILSGMPVQRLINAINNEDVSLLSTIPGLGKKTSARLILELKGKLPSFDIGGGDGSSHRGSASDDAVSALVNLGYKKPLAEKAVDTSVKNGSAAIEDIIREALKYLTEK
ncbi:MAG: Holliday junction branch migration protein RuvA [Nitrospirae bacterium]|nr:Holliday junction branch migration protein RuvA [Nitrospirota bacterium]